jgi:hypothetical protein
LWPLSARKLVLEAAVPAAELVDAGSTRAFFASSCGFFCWPMLLRLRAGGILGAH